MAVAHNVCVCEEHENVKLLIEAISHDCGKLLLMNKIVCDVSNPECMLNRCDKVSWQSTANMSCQNNCHTTPSTCEVQTMGIN